MGFKIDKPYRTSGAGVPGAKEAATVVLLYPPRDVFGDPCIEGFIGASQNVYSPVVHCVLKMGCNSVAVTPLSLII